MAQTISQANQEEYIWAMRMSLNRDTLQEYLKMRLRSATISSTASSLHNKKDRKLSPEYIEETKMKLMASLVPDEVIYKSNDYHRQKFTACFLFGDVSGFTDLAEKYSKAGTSGPSKMTQVLNKYLGAMVKEVLSFNGDVLKFSGDAFLAMFKPKEGDSINDVVHEAIDCALVIQKNYGSYQTDVGVMIRVKLAISVGRVLYSLIGTQTNSHYCVIGKPIWDVKAAEHISSAGDVIVAPAAWQYVNPNEYLHEKMPDRVHTKITGVGPNWRSVIHSHGENQQQQTQHNEDDSDKEYISSSSSNEDLLEELDKEEFSLRPSMNFVKENRIKKSLRKYIIEPVMKAIDRQEAIEYLTEMRQSVIVFINIISLNKTSEETVEIVDEAYKIVCRVVGEVKGCVNKLSLFDKDIMIVVVFGLRGLKDELECQNALRSAKKCHKLINDIPGVDSTSIGVTTGKTYCGVFGHTLRREYTVISLIVNKAARLMCNYKNKVTCDRETFLHSKMEPQFFILQERKALKGISHPGPVYEFVLYERIHTSHILVDKYPILGREREIGLFQQLLSEYFGSAKETKMLQIRAEARQGKTRLLDECILTAAPDILINKLHLSTGDAKVPYQAVFLLLLKPLKMSKTDGAAVKKRILRKVLRNTKGAPHLMCTLNKIFAVNFPVSKKFATLKNNEKFNATVRILRQLCVNSFTGNWLIAVDNLEYVDPQTWNVFYLFLELKNVFILGTLGKERIQWTPRKEALLSKPCVHIVNLDPIDKWYLGALACHYMKVQAIPAELEKIIQDNSNGCCGWIENLLISLVHDDALQIMVANLKDVNDLGLVSPPAYMMQRMTNQETVEWKHVMEEQRHSDTSLGGHVWVKYVDCCRGSDLNVDMRRELEPAMAQPLSVCVLSRSFFMSPVESELSMDCKIMKTFDSLTNVERLLMKCGSVLPCAFPRGMLLYVMNQEQGDKIRIALAIKKLFQVKVLCCGRGNSIEEQPVYTQVPTNPMAETEIKCRCIGLRIEPVVRHLPTYASCSYMQFKSSLIREITYNLLTDNQRKDFHIRAVRYLQRETRRCKSCGGEYFENIMETRRERTLYPIDKGNKGRTLRESSTKTSRYSLYDEKSFSGESRNSATSDRGQSIDGARQSSGSYNTGTRRKGSGYSLKSKQDDNRNLSRGSVHSSASRGSYKVSDNQNFKFFLSRVMRRNGETKRIVHQRPFSEEDFTHCRCQLILCATYAQLVDHCNGADDPDRLVVAMTEYSKILIRNSNIPLALRVLHKALPVIDKLYESKTVNQWKMTMAAARIMRMLGQCYFMLEQLDTALYYLHKCLDEYGLKMPATNYSKVVFGFRERVRIVLFPSMLTKTHIDNWESSYRNDLSECLALFTSVFMKRQMWNDAYRAAVWSFTMAVEAFSDFKVTCNGYTNMIRVGQHFRRHYFCYALEMQALKIVQVKESVDSEELICVSELYRVILYSRILRGNIESTIHSGYILIRVCSATNGVRIMLPILPVLMVCLLMCNLVGNVISVLHELDYIAESSDVRISAKIWYFSMCVCFHLETGYVTLHYNDAVKSFQLESQCWLISESKDALRRFLTVMWLWCVRNERWEEASLWFLHKKIIANYTPQDNVSNQMTNMYYLEGLLLIFVNKINKMNAHALIDIRKEVDSLIGGMSKKGGLNKILEPRFYHLKAYYLFIRGIEEKAVKLMEKAKKVAMKGGNVFETLWIDYTLQIWGDKVAPEIMEFWKDHSDIENSLLYHELESTGKFRFFSLPLPEYCA